MAKKLRILNLLSFKFLLFIYCIQIDRGISQSHDQNWLLGDGRTLVKVNPPGQGLMLFNFKNGLSINIDTTIRNICGLSFTNACISDKNGNLVAYTDGHQIYNRNHKIMDGGDTINPGNFWVGFLGYGYPIINGAIFLPIPNKTEEYVLIHKRIEWGKVIGRKTFSLCDRIYTTFIRYDNDAKIHKAYQKNTLLLEGQFSESEFAVAKHGNGRDYWVVARKIGFPHYYFFLIDPSGVRLHHEQTIGKAFFTDALNGNMIFSRSESMMARVIPQEGVELMDFDRCTGFFKNPTTWSFPDTFLINGGCAFSPSEKFLYVNSIVKIFQYDVSERFKSEYKPILVGAWDSVRFRSYETLFFTGRLALNNKIYYTVFGTNGYHLHTMHNPDAYGKACDFRNHDFSLPNLINGGFPFFPNFRLGPIKDSACDSLSKKGTKQDVTRNIFFNTIMDQTLYLNQSYPDRPFPIMLLLYNLEGRKVWDSEIILNNQAKIDISNIPSGMYFLRIYDRGNLNASSKIMIMR